jgi:RNA polymerase sigma factor (sigma-70 family)
MIAASKRPGVRNASASRRGSDRVKQRTQELLTCEIGFIPNSVFRELDADPSWETSLPDYPDVSEELAKLTSAAHARMPAHLERLCSAPLLTPEEERELFCQMNYLKYRANAIRSTLRREKADESKVTEIELLLSRATRVRNRIIHANVRLVMSIVKQFADDRNRFDDLLSEGISCLIKAVDKFDFDRGFRFSTYATRAVRREVFRLVQRHHRDRTRFATGAQELLSQQVNRGSMPEGVEMTWQRVDESICQMLRELDDREKFIVEARYGFDNIGEKPTFQRLGQLLGVSKERVRQIEQRALSKLRNMAQSLRLEPVA